MSDLEIAVEELYKRQNRLKRISGKSDKQGRWYPDETERRQCCGEIRSPSKAYPWSLFKHCCGVVHVANYYGVDVSALRKAYNKYKKEKANVI